MRSFDDIRGRSIDWRRALACPAVLGLFVAWAAGGGQSRADEAPTRQVTAGTLQLNVPQTWVEKPAQPPFRIAQFEVPPASGDKAPGELAVSQFRGGVGSTKQNVERWWRQFAENDRSIAIVQGESKQGRYTLVDLQGTYNKPIGPPMLMKSKALPDWRVLAVLLETPAGVYTLKLDGPKQTVEAARNDFGASFGGDREKEKAVKLEDLGE